MRRSKQKLSTPAKQLYTTKRNFLADRLIEKPNMKAYSSDKRPKVFSNSSQQKQLTPSITLNYHKKKSYVEPLPPIELSNKKKMKTEMSIDEEGFRLEMNQAEKKEKYSNKKVKNMMIRSKMTQSRMNRTLTQSREIMHLMSKMQGQKQEKSPEEKKVEHSDRTILHPLEEKLQLPSDNRTQIDGFISMVQENSISDCQFYYMIKKESHDYYNMEIMPYQKILELGKELYFTLSGSGVTKYENGRPLEFQDLDSWNEERQQFNELKQLQFFKKFNKWKSLKKWMVILSNQKIKHISSILEEKLFILQPEYRDLIIDHNRTCVDITHFKLVDLECDAMEISEFKKRQNKKKSHLINNLKTASEQMHQKSMGYMMAIVEQLKSQIIGEGNYDEMAEKKEKVLDEKMKILTQMGFPSTISYGNRSKIRNQFMRFLRLAYLLDFIAIEALGKMFVNSIQYLQSKLVPPTEMETFEKQQEIKETFLPEGLQFGVTCNPDGKNVFSDSNSEIRPLFCLEFEVNQTPNLANPPKKKCQYNDVQTNFKLFDLMGYMVKQAGGSKENTFAYSEDTIVTFRYSDTLSRDIIEIKPNYNELIETINEFFNEALDSIQIIDRWAKNPSFENYINVLQEWDQIIGDNWQKNDQKYLNPICWIREHNKFQNFKPFITKCVFTTYNLIEKLINQHNDIINTYWNAHTSNFESIKDSNIQDQSTLFENTYKMLLESEQYLNKFLLEKADIAIYSCDFYSMRKSLLDGISNCLRKLIITYSQIIRTRSIKIKEWLTTSISELSVMIVRIQEFVIKKGNLDRILEQFQREKDKLAVLKVLLKIVESSAFSSALTKEEKDKIGELTTLTTNLQMSINDTESHMPKYIQIFRREIKLSLDKFEKESDDLNELMKASRFCDDVSDVQKSAKQLQVLDEKVKGLDEYSKKHRKYEQVLEINEFTNFKDFRQIKSIFTTKLKVYTGIVDLQNYAEKWKNEQFSKINIKQMTDICDRYTKDLLTAERKIPDNKAIPIFKKELYVFKDAIPAISALRCPYLEESDYVKLQTLLKTDIDFSNNTQLKLGEFFKLPFQEFKDQIIDISVWATQYHHLKKELDGFQSEWLLVELKLKQFKEASEIIILYDIEELTVLLDESLAKATNIISNRYIGPLRERAEKIQNDIILGQEIVEKIVECQRKWVYLENIFAAQDIKKQLMVQANNFNTAHNFLKNLMKKHFARPLIGRFLKVNNLFGELSRILELLEQIEKKLEDYLQVKRKAFPRFYFISNDELVQILANSANINIIQKHINKLFEGISKMYIDEGIASAVEGMISQQGEMIKFHSLINLRFNIEVWLMNLQKEMTDAVKRLVRDGFMDDRNQKQKSRILWILNHKSQAVLTGNQIIWSHETQEAIKESSMKGDSLYVWYEILIKQLKNLTEQIQSGFKDPIYHKISVALITADVHNRDVVMNLISNEVESIHDFTWQQQLKYSIQDGEHCIVKQVSSVMDYGNEYLGATSRLVITPLTDRCWITITSALANQLGASPAGPAGTGKTESTKDLAKGLARVCIVFNCSEQITAQMMSKLFSGLAQQGAWTCLDQFNRIDIQVLSVIAQQLFSIRIGLKKDKGEVELEGKLLAMKKNFGVFITMNPGYAGRTQLPDNLKSLFRPVSMMIPDYAKIAQIMLFAEGFTNATELSQKMVQLYKLASEQLSQQKHYDFGLRAVKSLLVMAGELRRSNSKTSEDEVLIKAMKDSNIPKFLQNDILLFEALVSDLFPKVNIEKTINKKLQEVSMAVTKKRNLGNLENVAVKVIQLYEVLNIRFGVMIVGEAGVGKTNCYQILKNSMLDLIQQNPENEGPYYRVQEKVINPKSVTMGQLYGEIDLLTQEWTDGLLSSIMRECNNCEEQGRYWITLDGPVDAMWIQNLNTVLDDNMTLCLANGERMKLRPALRMLFEVQNLEAASPATVSRCGMVYIGKNNNYLHYIQLEIEKLPLEKDFIEVLRNNSLQVLKELIELREEWFQPIPSISLQIAQCFILLLKHYVKECKITTYDETIKKLNFISAFCIIWSVGCSIESQNYGVLENTLRNLVQNVFFPKTETIFDFFLTENHLSYASWESKLVDFVFEKDVEFHQIFVPTVNTLKYKSMMDVLLQENKPILFTGESGVGKTSLTVPHLFHLKNSSISTVFLNFSAKTKPKDTQFAIQAKLYKKGKTVFGARPNEKNVIFIDDINLPELEKEGAQPTIQLLRHFLDYKGFYDRHKLFWKQVVDTSLVSCGSTPSGGRNQLNPRFVRHSMVICLPQPSQSNLKKIFGSILKGFLQVNNFSEAVKKSADGIVASTLLFFNTIRKELRAIPIKFHYMFNLRDISKVFQGMLQCSVDTANSVEKMFALWYHELERIFSDRLVNHEDREWFINTSSSISKRFGEGIEKGKIASGDLGISFTTVMTLETEERVYEEVDDMKKIMEFFESKMYEYNVETNGKLELVFFKEAIQHVLRISRVMVQPRGNAMLIGVGGSGKQSLSKISAYISQCRIEQLEIGKGYNGQSFRGDIQRISVLTGVEQEKVCFLFLDTQILYQEFLQSINNMLNTGQVPNLFKKKEQIDDVINRVRMMAKKNKNIVDSPESLWSYFISNIRSNLHIVLCMSPAGDSLRVRCRKFPSLINCCTIDWFESWTLEALTTVAKKFISEMNIEPQSYKTAFTDLCTDSNLRMHSLCQQYYQEQKRKVQSTPKTFLDQLQLFNDVLKLKYREIENNKKILSEGLEKLYSTNDIVAKLKIQMTKLQPKLAEQCIKTEEFLKQLAVDKQEANIVEKDVEIEAQEANQQTKQIQILKADAKKELDRAMPMVLQAEEALKKINKNDITQIKGYANPHPIVQMVMEAVCTLLNEKTDWGSIKVTMMELNFLDRLKNFQRNSIPDNILKKLRTNYTSRAQFDPVIVGAKNMASKSLCMWCLAIDNYARVNKQVEPKKAKLKELEKIFEKKNKQLFMKQRQLNKVKEKVLKLQKECQQTLEYKNKLQSDLDLTVKRLERAEKLTILLKDEGLRWNNMIESFKNVILEIPGESFLSSVILSYLGAFTGSYRQNFVEEIMKKMKDSKIIFPKNFSLTTTMFDQITVRDWILEGLPNDPVSIDNAIIAKRGKRYPLMIDPQSQANKWLKINQKDKNLSVVNFDETHYLKTLETAVKCGYSVLIEEVEENLESSIDSLLYKKVQVVEGLKMIQLGDKKVPYDADFYLYMTTRMANPRFLAEVFNKATVINFSITEDGLKDQLLAEVSKLQKPQIQQQRDDIIVKVAANKKFLKQSQDKILKMLAESKGMVLDDIELITTLEESKVKSKEVEKDLEANSIVEEQINRARNSYLSVAIRGTILYFVISKLCLIEPMYEFSLTYVKKLYEQGLSKAEETSILELRIKRLNESITKVMFVNISRALFEAHKKLFSFLMCCGIKRNSKHILHRQWELFSKGAGLKPKNFKQQIQNPDPKFLSPDAWYFLHKLSQFKQYSSLLNEIKGNYEEIKSFFTQQNLYSEPFPAKQLKLNSNFTILLLCRIIKPQNLTFNMSIYVQKELGKFYDQPPVSTAEQVLSTSQFDIPVLFVLSTGVDPTSNILNYCSNKGVTLETISLGQGQGKKAESMIERAKIEGTWVLLNNCHLSKSWLGRLEKIIENFSADTIPNKSFRLLMSSMPVSYFPSNILQNCNKITLEPPRGIKSNIEKSFKGITEETLNLCPDRRKQWIRCLYSLTFFHALVQERRKYGSLGFNIRYEFNDHDFDMSVNTLKLFLSDAKEDINWQAIEFMIGHINYGGRVTDDWDRICLLDILRKCLNSDLVTTQISDKFYYSDHEDYFCLSCLTVSDFELSIESSLPSNDVPEVFGLNKNANLSYIIQESNRMISCINTLQPKGSANSNNENSTLQLIANLSILPEPIDRSNIPEHLTDANSVVLPSLTNFLLQEIDKFNLFLKIIATSLDNLERAIKGFLPMNEQLDEMMASFSLNRIPASWKKYCYETLKPLSSWFVDFKQRIEFLREWMDHSPSAYWISCFFFPQGLLTALLQTHARKNKIPIDTLSFKFKVLDIEKEKLVMPREGGYIYGLHFAGGRWDSNKDTLADERPGQINEPLPALLLSPAENLQIGENQYNCPCYKTSARSGVLSTTGQSTNFILGIHLNSKNEKPQYWTLRGCALICQLDH